MHSYNCPLTILLVEDETFVREVTREILQSAGHRVLCATRATEATTLFNDLASEIDLVLTDIILPGDTGRVLAANLLRQNPWLRVLYVSGYPDQICALQKSGEDCLPKPYSSELLLQKVSAMLSNSLPPHSEPLLMLDAVGA